MRFRMIAQLWNTNTPAFVSCGADQTENYMYISMKFGTGVHVFCWEVGVFNRSSFQSVSCKFFKSRSNFKVKNYSTMWKVSSQGTHMYNMKALSLVVRKLRPRLKFFKSRSNFKVKRSKIMAPCENVTKNTHVQYESHISSGKKVIAKVKVFVHASHADADGRAMTSAPRLARNWRKQVLNVQFKAHVFQINASTNTISGGGFSCE